VFTNVHFKNFGVFSDFRWEGHGRVNVVVGENDTGKSHLLKMLYVVAKSVEKVGIKGQQTELMPVIYEKIRWTFQPPSGPAALIRHGATEFDVAVSFLGRAYEFTISDETDAGWMGSYALDYIPARRKASAVFLPPKEVLTIFAAIEVSRGIHEIYGFDDTYYDLLKLLRLPPTQGKIVPELSRIADTLESFVGGSITRSGHADEFIFRRGEHTYNMPQTADGIKKIGILTNLIRNRCLTKGTILFLDEPETNLHPRAISVLVDVLFQLGQAGVQVYLATHSYFVLKQLEILAKRHKTSVPFCSLLRRGAEIEARFNDMRDGMPDSPILDESIRLFEQGFDVDMARAGE
jgi:energy-coupling factor transporter ATP-binding protein EcfA2